LHHAQCAVLKQKSVLHHAQGIFLKQKNALHHAQQAVLKQKSVLRRTQRIFLEEKMPVENLTRNSQQIIGDVFCEQRQHDPEKHPRPPKQESKGCWRQLLEGGGVA
jgi:hypothetical protein